MVCIIGQYTTMRDGTGSDRPTVSYAGVCSVDKSRLDSGITPTGVPDCGAGSNDPLSPSYCVVVEGAVCLDSGECGESDRTQGCVYTTANFAAMRSGLRKSC